MRRRDVVKYFGVTCASGAINSAIATTETTQSIKPISNDTSRGRIMSNANERVVSYIATWNETDGKRRRELVASTWSEDGSYVDAHRHAHGHAEIDKIIEQAQQQFPGYSLRLVSGIEAYSNYVRFSWAAGGAGRSPLYLGGTDFAVVGSDGRFQSVAGFVDAAPAR